MQIFIDADGCPVVDITLRTAAQYGISCTILCDTAHRFEREGATTVMVEKGADSVDFKLVNLLQSGDIAVTQDYGLAAMCLARGARPISQNGLIFTENPRKLPARFTTISASAPSTPPASMLDKEAMCLP